MAQQTAVDWLEHEIEKKLPLGLGEIMIDLFEQAKQMEREQIEKAFFKGHCDGYNAGVSLYSEVEFQSSDQYYTQTYGNNNKNK